MALINYANKEINAKIVYYGPGLSGKTTNIQLIHSKLKPEHRGKLITLPTQTDRTLFFDFLPVEIPNVKGFTTRFHLYTVPGQVFYNATRKMVLKGVDGVVFVADSQVEKLDDNVESLKNLDENLQEYGKSIKSLPLVIQFNKRDLKNISKVSDLTKRLNPWGYPSFEAIAIEGKGVMETLAAISRLVLKHLKESYDSQKILRMSDENTPDIGKDDEEQAITDDDGEKDEISLSLSGDTLNNTIDLDKVGAVMDDRIDRKDDQLGVMGEFENDMLAMSEDDSDSAPAAEKTAKGDKKVEKTPPDTGDFLTPHETPGEGEGEKVELVLGGEIERVGIGTFKLPLTFQVDAIKKDIVLDISIQITDSEKDRDIF
jgi:signal recognition particle receptor subunit beta